MKPDSGLNVRIRSAQTPSAPQALVKHPALPVSDSKIAAPREFEVQQSCGIVPSFIEDFRHDVPPSGKRYCLTIIGENRCAFEGRDAKALRIRPSPLRVALGVYPRTSEDTYRGIAG